ncbi:MAG: hypothetical protein IPN29_08910 [Saprospiraceae bacterium]|nr:hypothetical protein [Saprospiraceae bacterium]
MKTPGLFFKSLVILLLSLSMSSCYYDETVLIEESEDVGDISFSNDIIPIFNQSCSTTGCHSGSVSPDLRADKAYSALTNGNYINAADPANSELYLWMKGSKNLPMPLTGPNAAYNAKVLAWIKQGALNN